MLKINFIAIMTYNKSMDLAHSLRLSGSRASHLTVSLVGAGGKTSAIFQLARQLHPCIVTATSHLGIWQIPLANHHITETRAELNSLPKDGIVLVTGQMDGERTRPVSNETLLWLREYSKNRNIPLLVEADGSRQKPLKAPADHEPPIPEFSDLVILMAGLSGIGKPLSDEHIHRPEIFSQLSGLKIGQPITPKEIITTLTHPRGGMKNIPAGARRIAFLNQADTPELQSMGGSMARELLGKLDSVIVGSVQKKSFRTFEQTAGIILAAGKATRYGSLKQLLDWKGKPFVRQVAETALHAGLWPVVVVTGFHSAEVESSLMGLPISIAYNPDFEDGQSTSIRAGVEALPQNTGSAIFLLADQPQIPGDIIRALAESHTKELDPIIVPLVLEERRANPVLFDKVTFPDLLQLTGDVGGRALFSKYKVTFLPWHDDILLLDVDKPEDYQRLIELETI